MPYERAVGSIIMSGDNPRLLRAGAKTQTRRIVKYRAYAEQDALVYPHECPYGEPGDLLWVREAWHVGKGYDELPGSKFTSPTVGYEADHGSHVPRIGRYRHSRFMPRWASRLTLELTHVRVQRLQDISEEDALAEGMQWVDDVPTSDGPKRLCFGLPHVGTDSARHAYETLWESLHNPKGLCAEDEPKGWAANPLVWALTFRVHVEQVDSVLARLGSYEPPRLSTNPPLEVSNVRV